MESSPALSALLGLLLALWTAGAVWVMLRASGREQKSLASRKLALRLSRLIEEGPNDEEYQSYKFEFVSPSSSPSSSCH